MSIEQAVLEKLRQLPIEKQQEALDFVSGEPADSAHPAPQSHRTTG